MRQTKGHSRAAYRALWQQRVQAWQHSGLSTAEFARQHGYPATQLNNWISRLHHATDSTTTAPQATSASPLTPIHIIATTATAAPAPQIRITYQQCQCEFPSLPDPQWLAQWLQALQA